MGEEAHKKSLHAWSSRSDYSITPGELGPAAEERGFESLWMPEHTHIPISRKSPWGGGPVLPDNYRELLDPFLALTAAAMSTKRIKLATGICLVAERDPIHTAKTGCDPRLPEWRTLSLWYRRRMERRGDGWMPQGRNFDALAVLPRYRQMVAEAGRDPDCLPVSVFGAPHDAELLKGYRDARIERTIFILPTAARELTLKNLDVLAAVVRRVV